MPKMNLKDFGDLDLSPLPMPDFQEIDLMDMPNFEGDPFEQIYMGGDMDGSDNAIDMGGGFNLGNLFSGSGLGSSLGSLARGLFGSNQDGSLNLSSLLPLLGLLGGTINSNVQTNRASEQLQGAARQAQEDANRLIGGARDDFKPYQAAGVDALARMQAAPLSALAAGFQPIGSQSALADQFKSMTLANLARR